MVFAELFCGIAVFRTPQCPPRDEQKRQNALTGLILKMHKFITFSGCYFFPAGLPD